MIGSRDSVQSGTMATHTLDSPARLGLALRAARRANELTLDDLAQRTGFSLRFLSELERGKEGASIGRALRVAAAVGVDLVARTTRSPLLDLDRYPELKLLAWQRDRNRYLGEKDALALYEANWRFVESNRLLPRESALIRRLARRYGNGVLNV